MEDGLEMNDFTKEELLIMQLAVMRDMNQFDHILKTSPSMLKLKDKLDKMIDNYCDHTPSDAHYEQFRWQLCRKCGVQYK